MHSPTNPKRQPPKPASKKAAPRLRHNAPDHALDRPIDQSGEPDQPRNPPLAPPDLISDHYLDASGQRQTTRAATRRLLLAALGDPAPAASGNSPLPAVAVFRQHPVTLSPKIDGDYHWTLACEQGRQYSGHLAAGNSLTLPASLPQGYHRLTLTQKYQQWHCLIILAPAQCYQPPALARGQKIWGACIQLYSLKSLNNWGIGDFGDLQKLLRDLAHTGGGFVGLNPLHALFPAVAEHASPYSPSSRRWLNILYIDVNTVEDFQINPDAEAWWQRADTQQQLERVRNADLVDYQGVMHLKLTALRLAWRQFSHRHPQDKLIREFHHFTQQGGDDLYWQAVHDALHHWLQQAQGELPNWHHWPEHYQRRDSARVKIFCRNHKADIEFYCWLQWLAHRQLAACWQICQRQGMPIGLYRDLAVGVAQYSAQTWSDPALYCMDISIGAPPDPLGPQGQIWQLPPFNPHQLIARGYQPFIDLLRANMRYCGALRIDHVMSLMRLWWVPQGHSATEGAYVHYPVDDLLAILALESQRHHCLIIGEDLGLVPDSLREKLRASGVYTYKVLYFEPNDGKYLPDPASWPAQSLASINTHDLPTLRGYWESADLKLGQTLGLYPDPDTLSQLQKQRAAQKQLILDSLKHYHYLSSHIASQHLTPVVRRALYRYMALCQSALLGIQPEDWLEMADPVNVPGTDQQYPNWRRKLSRPLDEIFIDTLINRLFSLFNKYRKQATSKYAPRLSPTVTKSKKRWH